MANINYPEHAITLGPAKAMVAPERGGIVTGFSVFGHEILFLDRETFANPEKNVRGGIPLLFPSAGPAIDMPYKTIQHGFLRGMPFQLTEFCKEHAQMSYLHDASDPDKSSLFAQSFRATVSVNLSSGEDLRSGLRVFRLYHSFEVANLSPEPLIHAYGTHPYLHIPHGQKRLIRTNIPGFNPEAIDWNEEYDTPFENPGRVEIDTPGMRIIIASDSEFDIFYIWSLAGKDFLAAEPWTRGDKSLERFPEDKDAAVVIPALAKREYEISIGVALKD